MKLSLNFTQFLVRFVGNIQSKEYCKPCPLTANTKCKHELALKMQLLKKYQDTELDKTRVTHIKEI